MILLLPTVCQTTGTLLSVNLVNKEEAFMPLVKMLMTHADAECVLFGGRYYNITDKKLLTRLLGHRSDKDSPKVFKSACEIVKVAPKGHKIHQVEPADPADEQAQLNQSETTNDPVESNK